MSYMQPPGEEPDPFRRPPTDSDISGTDSATPPRDSNMGTGLYEQTVGVPIEDPEQDRSLLNFLKRNQTRLVIGTVAASTTANLVLNPLEEIKHQATDMAPYALAVGLGEAVWVGGAAMMLASIGNRIWNPFKIKKQLPQLAEQANNSALFKAGFWANTIAALSQFTIATGGVVTQLPPESWGGPLTWCATDLLITIAARRRIRRGIKLNTP